MHRDVGAHPCISGSVSKPSRDAACPVEFWSACASTPDCSRSRSLRPDAVARSSGIEEGRKVAVGGFFNIWIPESSSETATVDDYSDPQKLTWRLMGLSNYLVNTGLTTQSPIGVTPARPVSGTRSKVRSPVPKSHEPPSTRLCDNPGRWDT